MVTVRTYGQLDLDITQYHTMSVVLYALDSAGARVDLTGKTASAMGRASASDASPVWTVTGTVDASADTITLTFDNSVTAALTADSTGVWDLVVTTSGEPERWVSGAYIVTAGVTHS